MIHARRTLGLLLGSLLLPAGTARAGDESTSFEQRRLESEAWHWRCIGPFRGGRVTAVCGVRAEPDTYYMGATGGGVWKSEDAGRSWRNVSDGGLGTMTIGAIAVAEGDPNVVYVGTGEAAVRGVTTSHGDGVYRSVDGGASWTHCGLRETRHISRIRVDPRDPDRVYVAAQGPLWNDSEARGIYRSRDGGASWEKVLAGDASTGASDLALDVRNPRVLYAAMWDHRRTPWQVRSGGEGSAVHRSEDGGDTWVRLDRGLPQFMGKVGVAVSPARPSRVWVLAEAEEGGLFRSDDGGRSFQRVNSDRLLRARAWYYTHVFAHPTDADTVFVLNAPMLRSVDGGRTFGSVPTPHGDNHDLWIHPDEPRRMINGNDGGANVSVNAGASWSRQDNQPTAQFYRVIADERFPYHVYGGQQDNSTVCIPSRVAGGGIGRQHWYAVGGCESAWVAMDPREPRYVYAGCYQGIISEFDHETGLSRDVMAYPFLGLGSDPSEQEYRFNWNAPILVSAHDPEVLYHAAQLLLRSEDRGRSWREISPDLSFADQRNLGPGGVPITNEAAGAEVYHTILCVQESRHDANTLWVGTDDGRVHRTTDGGQQWQDVTPYDLGVAMVNSVEISRHDPQTVTLAVTRYKMGDLQPYVYRSEDGGQSWEVRVDGIADEHYVRVVREDRVRPGLLYAGTEGGLYLSFDAGRRWHRWQSDLPVVPITDLDLAGGDLIAATQGRAFWILDDLSPLWEVDDTEGAPRLCAPRSACRWGGGGGGGDTGENAPAGALLHYELASAPEEGQLVELAIACAGGELLRRWRAPGAEADEEPQAGEVPVDPRPLPVEPGLHRFVWDLRVPSIAAVPDQFSFGGRQGYRVAPGHYEARLRVGDTTQVCRFEVFDHPAATATAEEWQAQQALAAELWSLADTVHRRVNQLREVRAQVRQWAQRAAAAGGDEALATAAEELIAGLDDLEQRWIQPRQQTFQDVINFPNRLGAHLVHLMGAIDGRGAPLTDGARRRATDLRALFDEAEAGWRALQDGALASFERQLESQQVPRIVIPTERDSGGD